MIASTNAVYIELNLLKLENKLNPQLNAQSVAEIVNFNSLKQYSSMQQTPNLAPSKIWFADVDFNLRLKSSFKKYILFPIKLDQHYTNKDSIEKFLRV